MPDDKAIAAQQHTSNILCIVRLIGWLNNSHYVVQEIKVWADGVARVVRTQEFYGIAGACEVSLTIPSQLLSELQAEVKQGSIFALINDVPTFVEGLGDSRALLQVSPGIRQLRSFVDKAITQKR